MTLLVIDFFFRNFLLFLVSYTPFYLSRFVLPLCLTCRATDGAPSARNNIKRYRHNAQPGSQRDGLPTAK
jgi:hypothetical protein